MSLLILGEAEAKDGNVTVLGIDGFQFSYDGKDFKAENKSVEIYGFEGNEMPEVWEIKDFFVPEIWQKSDDDADDWSRFE